MLGGYLGVLWLRPLWLLKLPSQDITVPWTTWKVPLGMVRWFKYRDRVLDVWVKQHWKVAQQEFLKLPTVDNRAIHIPLPVQLDRTTVAELTGAHLVPTFQKKTAVLLLCGEGGAGKTSLACQIAQWGLEQQLSLHRMIPVLLETELDDEKEDLLAAIQGRLNALTDQPDPIEPEFLKKLLQRQRVLVIVDRSPVGNGRSDSQPDQSPTGRLSGQGSGRDLPFRRVIRRPQQNSNKATTGRGQSALAFYVCLSGSEG